MSEPAAEGFVTVAEAARALQLSERQVRRYAGRLAESDRLTPDAMTGASPARSEASALRVRLPALAALAGKVLAEEKASDGASGSLPEVTGASPAPAGHGDRLPDESVRPVSGAMVSEDLAALREQLASVIAERDGLTARLADTASDRDAWKGQAQELTQALQRAQDETRAARVMSSGRVVQQIEASGLTGGSQSGDTARSGSLDTVVTHETGKAPWWAFWRRRGSG